MRFVVQRVSSAQVSVNKTIVGKIGPGYFVLVGISKSDTEADVDELADKLMKLRIMSDDKGKMNLSIVDVKGSILIVSQFTLYADTSKGNRPSFIKAAVPDKAKHLYDYLIAKLRSCGVKVETGEFGAYMKIKPVLDGPVTISLSS